MSELSLVISTSFLSKEQSTFSNVIFNHSLPSFTQFFVFEVCGYITGTLFTQLTSLSFFQRSFIIKRNEIFRLTSARQYETPGLMHVDSSPCSRLQPHNRPQNECVRSHCMRTTLAIIAPSYRVYSDLHEHQKQRFLPSFVTHILNTRIWIRPVLGMKLTVVCCCWRKWENLNVLRELPKCG